jgi:hypothetical protein
VDEATAREYLARGLYAITQKAPDWDRREGYFRGTGQDLPFAPEGVNQEYLELREQAMANVLGLAMLAPIQRCRADGFRTGRDAEADLKAWNEVWQPNQLDSRQRIVYTQMLVHGRGVMSVWPNRKVRKSPVIRPENGRRVHMEMDPEDPFTVKWTVKTFTLQAPPASGLWLPEQAATERRSIEVAVIYDDERWVRFEKVGSVTEGAGLSAGNWEVKAGGKNPLGESPFVPFDNDADADGKPQSALVPLMPAQDAINTIRFNTLLAMQFSAFRQRIFTGYDPVQRDAQGNPIWMLDSEGNPLLDANGQKRPVLNSPGRVGVDRALVFPGTETKVFDLQESNLKNYIEVLGEFLSQFFALGQIPPQYLLSRMANLSGDALAGAESTLASLVSDLQRWMGESLEQVMRLANRARGEDEPDLASEVIWADAEARSFSQTIDAITKLISVNFPTEAAFELIPSATPQKVQRWMEMRADEALDPIVSQILRDTVPPGDASAGVGA